MKEVDIWHAARQMVEIYADDAGIHAALRADALLDQGDVTGCRAWTRIVAVIKELLRDRPEVGQRLN